MKVRDIVVSCVAVGMDTVACQVKEFMTSNPITVTPESDLEEAARVMAKEQVRRLPVAEEGCPVGMLSSGDIALTLQGNDNLVAETMRKIFRATQVILPC